MRPGSSKWVPAVTNKPRRVQMCPSGYKQVWGNTDEHRQLKMSPGGYRRTQVAKNDCSGILTIPSGYRQAQTTQNEPRGSVATVMTDVFRKNWIVMARKLAKTVKIFVGIEHMKNRRVTFWPKRIGRLFPTLWSGHEFGHEFGQISWPLHSVGNIHPILLGQNVTPQSSTFSISRNILTVLANFLGS